MSAPRLPLATRALPLDLVAAARDADVADETLHLADEAVSWAPGLTPAHRATVGLVGLSMAVIIGMLLRDRPWDSLRQRVTIWRVALQWWWAAGWKTRLLGFGYHGWSHESQWWSMQRVTPEHFHQAHNDLVQHVFEWGLLGLSAVAVWLGRVGLHAAWGDPLTGAFVAALLTALIQFPCRVPSIGIPMLAVAALLGSR